MKLHVLMFASILFLLSEHFRQLFMRQCLIRRRMLLHELLRHAMQA